MGGAWPVVGLGVMFAVALAGTCLRRWADAYAQRLAAGAEATAGTLWRAARELGRRRFDLLRDGGCAVLLGLGVGALFLMRGDAALALSGLGLGLVALAWIDGRSGLLPDALTLPLMVSGWLWGPLPLLVASSASALIWAILSAAAGLYRWLRGHDGFGGGDVKYLAALAAWLGVMPAFVVLWSACVLGMLAWVCLPRVRQSGACRFGPCLTLAALPGILGVPAVQSWF